MNSMWHLFCSPLQNSALLDRFGRHGSPFPLRAAMLLCQLLLIEQGNANKFTLNEIVIALLILSPKFFAEAESVP